MRFAALLAKGGLYIGWKLVSKKKAVEINRANSYPYAETYSWRACAERFMDNLVPMGALA
jgi:hypothetical protein